MWRGFVPTAGQVTSRSRGSRLVESHERSIPSTKEEFRIDERAEQRVARRLIESPQSLCLGSGQPQSGHLRVLPAYASKYILMRLLLMC
jgi:hypothetical protein